MNISLKICDICDTCVYTSEYEIINGDVVCFLCIEEEEEKKDNEIQSGRMGDIQSPSSAIRNK